MAAGNGIRKWRTQVSKSVKNGQKMPSFWHLHVPIRSLERGIGKETDIHMMNTQVVRPTTSLWVQNTAKSALKKHPFCIPFQITPSRAVFYSHGLHWAPLW